MFPRILLQHEKGGNRMALFGRRKPGFSKEVELKPDEIPGEFSDALDPAVNRALDNPKIEKAVMAARAAEVTGEEKTDLMTYLESLPEVEDPFPPSEPDPEPAEGEMVEMPEHVVLACFIRERSQQAMVTPRKFLEEDAENLEELLTAMFAEESCKDICTVKGQKDEYYYSEENMAHNYAKVAVLVEEKDMLRTIAEMVRFNCKAFPTPTPLYYFRNHPYSMTKVQVEQAVRRMKTTPEYADIQELTAKNGEPYLFSEPMMSRKYAQALANSAEAREADM